MQVEEIKVGLIIYFKDNIQNPQQVFELNKTILEKAKIPPFIALDQEGGMVARVTEGIVQSPGAMAIGATHKPQYAYQLAYNMGCELRALGFNFTRSGGRHQQQFAKPRNQCSLLFGKSRRSGRIWFPQRGVTMMPN